MKMGSKKIQYDLRREACYCDIKFDKASNYHIT